MRRTGIISSALLVILLVWSCATQQKARSLSERRLAATIQLPGEKEMKSTLPEHLQTLQHRDTIVVTDDSTGRQMILMNAVSDENGEMIAHDEIQAAYVTARFRNVAERHGKVDIEFQIIVPEAMQDPKWQLRFHPQMYILEDSLALDDVIVTGSEYRKAQLRGYQQYERFLSRIVNDSTVFVNFFQLELFLKRNIPELYAFKRDTTFVSDEQFASVYGVTEQEAVQHYTNRFRVAMNDRRKAMRGKMYRHYVKAPIVTEGLRLDTVIRADDGDFVYNYVQTVATRPKLRKVDIVLSGEIFEQDRRVYDIPRTEPLTFYISSLSSFVDGTQRFLTRVIERSVEANTACWIDFAQGRAEIDERLSNNASEIGRIKANVASLIENRDFDLDSIVVTASASPEGSWRHNESLSLRRSRSVSDYFSAFIRHYSDSLDAEAGVTIDFDSQQVTRNRASSSVPFVSRSNPENWEMLDVLVAQDTLIGMDEKERYLELKTMRDPDSRERALQSLSCYRHMREVLYPRLRTVRFDFHLHRKGMVKDTIHTTVLDSVYMEGVQAIRDRDYARAVTILRPYNDYNAAVAYCAMDYNESALAILRGLDRTAEVNYMLAIVFSRRGDEQSAVQHYLRSCAQNPSYVHRGGLDPEISVLIKKYGLNRQDDEDDEFFY